MPVPVYAFMEAGWILDAVESGRPDEAVVVRVKAACRFPWKAADCT